MYVKFHDIDISSPPLSATLCHPCDESGGGGGEGGGSQDSILDLMEQSGCDIPLKVIHNIFVRSYPYIIMVLLLQIELEASISDAIYTYK